VRIDKNVALNIVTIILAFIACIVSIRSCSISQEALKTASAQFVAEKRPYLVVVPAKFTTSNKYLEIEKMEGERIRLRLRLKLENIGNVAAIDIRSTELPVIGKQGPIPGKFEGTPTSLELGPGQHIYKNHNVHFSGNEVGYAKKTLSDLRKNPVEIWESVRYRSEIDSTVAYETGIGYRISADNAILLFQETKRLPGSMIVPRP
jgi:hypothetical protein